jgi:hypothetical protein
MNNLSRYLSKEYHMDNNELKGKMIAELQEIDKYKWCLGVKLGHDPLNDRTLNDIYTEWISKNAKAFQSNWEASHKSTSNPR